MRAVRPALVLTVCLLATACGEPAPTVVSDSADADAAAADFVGSAACASCHAGEYERWQGSHHQLAMQVATDDTVLGDFDEASIDYYGRTTTFARDGDRFVVRTGDAANAPAEFDVTHTFGVAPLQQYLVLLPDGRRQALTYAWDARPAADGGQRWYHLYPDEDIGPDDVLHWTGRYFTWNTMCAECHSTNVDVAYDAAADRFATTWSEISVGCEACHGPGSAHVAAAERGETDSTMLSLDDHRGAAWVMNPETGIAARDTAHDLLQQPESCGRCHSRRAVLTADYDYGRRLLDTHGVSLLDDGLYEADGRLLDEVYVYGSFVQSRMYRAGVTCSDCHDPHGPGFAGSAADESDASSVCAQCHLPAVFATATHGDSGADTGNCVACHMPDRVYMGVDARRDHSFRLPGTADDPAHYGADIAAARIGSLDLDAAFDATFPAIARATLLAELPSFADATAVQRVSAAFSDPDPLVRVGALRGLRAADPAVRGTAGSGLLTDPVRAVRVEAARLLADVADLLSASERRTFADAAGEYRESLRLMANYPENLVQLADFEMRTGRDGQGGTLLRRAIRLDPDFALARHSYGLWLVRAGDDMAALEQLRFAAELAPDDARFAYVYAVALYSNGDSDAALAVVEAALVESPADPELLQFARLLNDAR